MDVRIRLETTDMAESPVTTVDLGQHYLLSAYVQDTRPNPEGVFAAFMDVEYDPTLTSLGGAVQYGPAFPNGQTGDWSTAGLIDEIGTVARLRPLGQGEFRLFTIPFAADSLGVVNFVSSPADIFPQHDTLLFGQDTPVPISEISYGQVSLSIVPEPSGWTFVLSGLCLVGVLRKRPLRPFWQNGLARRLAFRQNGGRR